MAVFLIASTKIGGLPMPRKKSWYSILLIICIAGLCGCYPTRSLKKGQQWLLKSNSVKIAGPSVVGSGELTPILKQRPNRAVSFGIPAPSLWGSPFKWDVVILRFNLRAWNIGRKGKGPFSRWLRERVGEPPVIYDSLYTTRSKAQLHEYMFQKGYFENKTEVQARYNGSKRMVRVAYIVHPGEPYKIKDITASIPDTILRRYYTESLNKTFIKSGDIYDYEKLDKERTRIVDLYQNAGYYEFNRDHVRIDVDSALGSHQVSMTLVVKNYTSKTDSGAVSRPHIRFVTRNVYAYPDYDFFSADRYRDTVYNEHVRIIFNDKLAINNQLIINNVLIEQNWYNKDQADLTYRNFSSLNLYKNIRVEYKKVKSALNDKLDAYIYLSPMKRNSFSSEARLETRASNGNSGLKSTYNFGVSGNVSFTRKNAFRNGEILKLGITAGLEPFFLSDSAASKSFFNTTEIGPSMSLTFPRFLLPIRQEKFSKSARANTIVAASYNILQNEDIRRRASKFSLSYEWNESLKKKHIVNPLEFSLVRSTLSTALENKLNQIGDPFLKNTYSNQVIIASSYAFIYTDQYDAKSTKAYYNRSKIEGSGNLLRTLANKSSNWPQENGSYLIYGVPFAQYLRVENEFKTVRQTIFNNVVAFRLYTGIAKPFNNLGSLPFEKSFFAGGSNGIRAWGARSLGPGSYMDTTSFRGFLNRLGELQLESNIEYRFKITKLLEWAFFADAGNIWVLKERGTRQGTEFTSQFYKQIALGAGFGARFNFDFVILRFDVALPIHDPSKPAGEKWFYQEKDEYNAIVDRYNERNAFTGNSAIQHYRLKPNFNVGIGYPF